MSDPFSKNGLIAPLRRDGKRDFVHGKDPELLKSKILQVLLTEGQTPQTAGEIPWRTNLGSALYLLRHQRNDYVLKELAHVYVHDALSRWLPEVEITELDAWQNEAQLWIRLRYRTRNQQESSTVEIQL